MFSVYGVMGRLFSGPLDQMREVGAVNTLARSRSVGRIGQDPSSSDSGDNLRRAAGMEGSPHRPIDAYMQAQSAQAQRHPLTRVLDVMSRKLLTIALSATVLEGWQRLSEHGIGQAPVVDAKGMLVGMLLRADLLRADHLPGPNAHPLAWRAWLMQPVADVMWTPVPSVQSDADIRHVARLLLDTGLPGLPVVDANGKVAGFVSRSDLLRAIVNDPPLDLWG
ncbi:MAG: CBS domain-containing protein [Betaproteobacteria bacterium]